ncbi:hypothetical protein BC834DRAFT_974744 [Gloeopeniophorella convolvens]|nr:hypothetical protein BC834DRAFT_974744 [Gloeopeniophorella convolvens]
MLHLARTLRAARALARNSRALSSAPAASDASPAAPKDDAGAAAATPKPAPDSSVPPVSCMFVYPWGGITSPAEGFAVAHALQAEFGRAREVIFPRDPELPAGFQPFFYLIFDDRAVRALVPAESTTLQVQVPRVPRGDGNVGLEDMLRAFGVSAAPAPADTPSTTTVTATATATATTEPAPAEDDSTHTLDVHIQWSRNLPRDLAAPRPTRREARPNPHASTTAAAWLAFGGFAPPGRAPRFEAARSTWAAAARAPGVVAAEQERAAALLAARVPGDGDARGLADALKRADARVRAEAWAAVRAAQQARADADAAPELRVHAQPQMEAEVEMAEEQVEVEAAVEAEARALPPTEWEPLSIPQDPTTAAAAAPEPTPDPAPETPESEASKMSRRERILHLARQNARTPLPPSAVPSAGETPSDPAAATAAGAAAAAEEEAKARTIRERLWRLVGRDY